MRKKTKIVFALLVVMSATVIELKAYAQLKIPKESIPSHIPTDVKEAIAD
ncbi:MAG TPA: hypothetical protein ACFYEK_12475 [Candidatus Wunengus sp. YC60]